MKQLDAVTLTVPTDVKIAVIGGSGSGKDVLGQVLARLVPPTGGSIKIDGEDFFQLPEYVLGSRTAYIGQETYLFPLSVRDNLLFGLKHRPVTPANYDEATRAQREAFWREAERAGNPPLDPNADWIDYELAGATGPGRPAALHGARAASRSSSTRTSIRLGLRGAIDAVRRPDLAEKILKARHALHGRLQDASYAGLVEPFNAEHYNKNLSVAENLLFGTPVGKEFDGDNLAADPYMQSVLQDDSGSTRTCCAWASPSPRPWSSCSPACRPTIRCSSSTASSRPTNCPTSALLLQRLGGKGVEAVPEADRRAADDPAAALHRGAPSPRPDRCRDGRPAAGGPPRLRRRPAGSRCAAPSSSTTSSSYNSAATLQDNILFGRLVYGQAQAEHAHRHADLRGPGRARPARLGDRGRAGLQCRRGRQAPGGDPAPEARHRARR